MSVLSHNTMIPLGLVITMAGIVFSAGILYNKVDNNDRNLTEFKSTTNTQFSELNHKVDRLMLISSPAISSADDTHL